MTGPLGGNGPAPNYFRKVKRKYGENFISYLGATITFFSDRQYFLLTIIIILIFWKNAIPSFRRHTSKSIFGRNFLPV